jgi:hypothetical protein
MFFSVLNSYVESHYLKLNIYAIIKLNKHLRTLFTDEIKQEMHIYSYKYAQSHFINFQQHVSVTSVTNIRVAYNKNIVNI